MRFLLLFSCGLFLALNLVPPVRAQVPEIAPGFAPLDPARIRQIAELLPKQPGPVAPPLSDREAWASFAARFGQVVEAAEKVKLQPTPELTDALFQDYARTGQRTGDYGKFYDRRRYRLKTLTLAECALNDGRFIAALEAELNAILAEKTWVMPPHDPKLQNFNGEIVNIDLGAASTAAGVATSVALLGDKLPADLRGRVRAELERRIFAPYRQRVRTGVKSLCYWVDANHNWNAVCHGGVVLAALAILPGAEERAEFVAGAERYLPKYLAGFPKDGYCLEGLGYWNYGFSHYVLLAETLFRLTDGRIDLYAAPIVKEIAAFPVDLEVAPGIYPYFGDSRLGGTPMWWINRLCNPHLGLPSPAESLTDPGDPGIFLYGIGLTAFPLPPGRVAVPAGGARGDPLRGWFSDAGILVSRSGDRDPGRMAVVLKGGRGGANHSHADLGQFVVALHGRTPLLDPGSENYTEKTFTKDRFTIPRINSFGHAVPKVGGRLQLAGKTAEARLVRIELTPERDTLVLDLTRAYDTPGLRKLEREFVYTRTGAGSLKIVDRVEFDQPQAFGGALLTMGTMEKEAADTLIVTDGPARVRVAITAEGGNLDITTQRIETSRPPEPLRIGVDLTGLVQHAVVTYLITPLP